MDDFPLDLDYRDYIEESHSIRSNLSFSHITQKDMLAVPVYREEHEETLSSISGGMVDDSKPIVDLSPKHIILYKSMVQNLNEDAEMCSDSIYGRLTFRVLTNDIPGVEKGHTFPFLEDARKYDSVYSMYKKDTSSRSGIKWMCDNPFDRYMRQNYMPYLGVIPNKLSMTQHAAYGLQKRIALMDKGFENLLYVVNGEKVPILRNGSAGEFFKHIREHEAEYRIVKTQTPQHSQ